MRITSSVPFRVLAAITLITASIGCSVRVLRAQTAAPAGETRTFVIRNARVFDGEKLLSSTDVSVEKGLIKVVGKNQKVPRGKRDTPAPGAPLPPVLFPPPTHTGGNALEKAFFF